MKTIIVNDVKDVLDNFAPIDLAFDYDNVGLIIGSKSQEVSGVLVCLDATLNVLKEAKEKSCNLIVSHHPPIFNGLVSVDVETEKGQIIEFAIANKISILSYHTNLDVVEGGINSYLAKKFMTSKSECLNGENKNIENKTECTNSETKTKFANLKRNIECVNGGALFELQRETNLVDFVKIVSTVLGDNSLKVCGNKEKQIKKVFVVSGAGGRDESAYDFAKDNADVFLSAEVKHSLMISAIADDFAVIELSHYYSEIGCLDIIFDVLNSAFGDMKIIKSEQRCPFWTMEEI